MAPGDMRELMCVSSADPVWPGQSKLCGCVFQLKCFLTTSRRRSLSLYLAGNVSLKNSLLFKLPSCSGQCTRPVTGSSAGHTQVGGEDEEDNVSTATAAGGFTGSQLLDMTNVTENTGFSTRAALLWQQLMQIVQVFFFLEQMSTYSQITFLSQLFKCWWSSAFKLLQVWIYPEFIAPQSFELNCFVCASYLSHSQSFISTSV